jgi:hypothetical protein
MAALTLSCAAADTPPAEVARAIGHRSALTGGVAADDSSRTANAPKAKMAPAEELGSEVRYVVELGEMHNRSAFGGDESGRVLHDAALSHAHALKEAAVVVAGGPLAQRAAERHLPIFTLDGVVMLTETPGAEGLRVRASVEFSVRRDQVLKAVLSGAATAVGSSPSISERGRRQLEGGAIDGAVEVAMRSADQGLMLAVR